MRRAVGALLSCRGQGKRHVSRASFGSLTAAVGIAACVRERSSPSASALRLEAAEGLVASPLKAPPRSATERLLQDASRDLDGSMSTEGRERFAKVTPSSQAVYGEITFEGVRIFMEHCLGIDSADRPPPARPARHVFYDLGSGIGRMVMQVHLDYPQVQRSVGVELSRDRHEKALELRQRVLGENRSSRGDEGAAAVAVDGNGRSCELLERDILEADFSDATIVWLANSFMTEGFLAKFCSKLAVEAPHLQYIGVNDALSEWDLPLPGFFLQTQMRVPMSWDREWTASVYRRL